MISGIQLDEPYYPQKQYDIVFVDRIFQKYTTYAVFMDMK